MAWWTCLPGGRRSCQVIWTALLAPLVGQGGVSVHTAFRPESWGSQELSRAEANESGLQSDSS